MTTRLVPRSLPALGVLAVLTLSSPAIAAESLCDTSFQDCRARLLGYINKETVSIDAAMWFMEDQGLANAIIARHNVGVRVRLLVDPRRNSTTPVNAVTLQAFKDAGIPMRYKLGGGIMHWKFMIFNGQNILQFSAANYSDYYFRPVTPYTNYTDEGIYFGDDPAVINSFRRKFDDGWASTTTFANYANVSSLARAYPLYTIDPDLNFVPGQDFAKRSVPLYDRETTRIDVQMYKITEPSHADGMIRAVKRGIPVRVITEPDLYRNASNVWQAYHVDRMYMGGVQVRVRAHAGFLHQKSTLLYSQALTVFGSSNWTLDSNRVQYEHNYFTDKAWFFTWIKNNFLRKWYNKTGNIETKAFVPLAPSAPVYVAPANGTTGVTAGAGRTISWKPGSWAHRADVYFGTSATPPLLAANVTVSPGTTRTYTLPTLAAGTTYYWKIVSRTMAQKSASGPVRSFRTAG